MFFPLAFCQLKAGRQRCKIPPHFFFFDNYAYDFWSMVFFYGLYCCLRMLFYNPQSFLKIKKLKKKNNFLDSVLSALLDSI
jgi:hypothetical protein